MKSIQARFLSIRDKHPEKYTSYICFAKAIRGQKLSHKMISKWFNILVNKDDYVQKDRNAIVAYLHELSNKAEEGEF